MVKINESSPQKRTGASSSLNEPSDAGLRLVSVSSPSRASPRKRVASSSQGSPYKTSSPLKTSPHKAHELTRASPRKKLMTSADNLFDGARDSPQKRRLALFDEGSPRKLVLKLGHSPRKAQPQEKLGSQQKNATCVRMTSPLKKEMCLSDELFDPVAEVQRVLRQRISQKNHPPTICGYERERKQLRDLIKRTALTGESNSMLLIGPRGCGKSMLVSDVIEDLYTEERIREDLMLVRLNGLLQSDDRIALREMTRQLQLENTVGDRVFGSFAETLQFLLEALKKGDQGSKPTLFVLEEFDLFAQHKNQTLLYNLFDISQSAQAPICVIGITCRLDVVELLEKRVKSRFSHRQIHLFNKLTLGQYRSLCQDYLSLPEDFADKGFLNEWNSNIESLLDEVSVKDVLERQYNLMNDVRGLLHLLTYPICNICPSHPTITASDLITSFKLISTDTKSAMLHGISILELAIIIAMKHLTEIYEGEPFNFEMVYSEYLKFARHRSGMQVYEKAIVMKAYEHLQTLELVRPQGGSGGGSQKEYRLMNLLVHPAQILDALQKYPSCPTEIKQWAAQSIN